MTIIYICIAVFLIALIGLVIEFKKAPVIPDDALDNSDDLSIQQNNKIISKGKK
jgi:hypothetical protein